MTTRHCGYVVTLAEDIREDDGEAVVTALRMVKGVVDVSAVEADPWDGQILRHRIQHDLFKTVRDALFGKD